jgi:hypothetical protein
MRTENNIGCTCKIYLIHIKTCILYRIQTNGKKNAVMYWMMIMIMIIHHHGLFYLCTCRLLRSTSPCKISTSSHNDKTKLILGHSSPYSHSLLEESPRRKATIQQWNFSLAEMKHGHGRHCRNPHECCKTNPSFVIKMHVLGRDIGYIILGRH